MPKLCAHARPTDAINPEWQCPSCEKAYAKAPRQSEAPAPACRVGYINTVERSRTPWLTLAVSLLLIAGLAASLKSGYTGLAKLTGLAPGQSEADVRALAAGVKAGEIVMYTTTSCPYCAQARSWLNEYAFAYTECDMQARPECDAELRALGGDGVPYLVVRGQHMREGFNSDQFLALLGN